MLRRAKGGRDVDEGSARRARAAEEDVEGQERSAGEVVVVDKAGDGEEGVAVGVAGGGGNYFSAWCRLIVYFTGVG